MFEGCASPGRGHCKAQGRRQVHQPLGFPGLFTVATYEAEVKTFVEAVPNHSPLWVSRTRQAFKAAYAAMESILVKSVVDDAAEV